MGKPKEFIKRNWRKWIKGGIALLIGLGMAVGGYFILAAMGFNDAEKTNRILKEAGPWMWVIIAALQVFQVIFIPVSNQVITAPMAMILQDHLLELWLTSWASIWAATLIIYAIGRWGGRRLVGWILGDKEQAERCSRFIARGWAFYPLGMLLPLPDDIVTAVAGMAKMSLPFVAVSAAFTRGIDTACTVFGFGILTRNWWGWLIMGAGMLLLAGGTIILWRIERKKEATSE